MPVYIDLAPIPGDPDGMYLAAQAFSGLAGTVSHYSAQIDRDAGGFRLIGGLGDRLRASVKEQRRRGDALANRLQDLSIYLSRASIRVRDQQNERAALLERLRRESVEGEARP